MKLEIVEVPQVQQQYVLTLNEDELKYIKYLAVFIRDADTSTAKRLANLIPTEYSGCNPNKCFR